MVIQKTDVGYEGRGRETHHAQCELAVGVHNARAHERAEALCAVERERAAVVVDGALAAEPVAERDS